VTTPKVPEPDYLRHLARESARFAAALETAAADARVPSCPDWDAQDLLWHLAEVQWFWGQVVRNRLTSTEEVTRLDVVRPARQPDVAEFYAKASSDLQAVLAAAEPQTRAWTWADEQTVGFIRRRQAHEALIHRVDAELTAGQRTAMDPRLSADGIDEALRIMYGGTVPAWGDFAPAGGSTLRIQATDTGDSWFLTLGRFSGTDPDDGKSYDRPAIHAAEHDPGTAAAATVRADAADLDCWLWHRPPLGTVERTGDVDTLASFDSIIADGVQ